MISRIQRSSLFLSCFLFYAASIPSSSSSSSSRFTNETDRQSLLAIKHGIKSDPFRVLSSWNDSLHFCNWRGIECSRRHGRVKTLNLSSLQLSGSLSPHIGNLTFLRMINLVNNSFRGEVPHEIGRVFRLQFLYLASNSFHGEISSNLSHCSEITELYLYENHLGGEIPPQLGFLSKLRKLSIHHNQLTGTIPASFGNLSALRMIDLGSNNLEGSIPFEMGKISNLVFLRLSFNNLSGIIPQQVFNLSSISVFAVAFNLFDGTLPSDLGLTLPNLRALAIGANLFSGHIPASIANATGLVIFDVAACAFVGPVPENIGTLQALEFLNFNFNPLGADHKSNELSNLIKSLANCSSLRNLYLTSVGLRGALPGSVANVSTALEVLTLGENYISGSIPEEIGKLSNLVLLVLATNKFTGHIPDSIGKLSNLQGLHIYSNEISGKIPPSLGNITQISALNLRNNLLEGTIPASLGNFRHIQWLDLSANRLTGEIPEQVMALSSLSIFLNLFQNHLTGSLSPQVGSLTNLGTLDLSDNRLSGRIPSTLGNCLLLEFILMRGNSLEGTIPSSFERLRGLQGLDLSQNNFSGGIPKFLGKLPFIWYVNLSFNLLEGEVPNEGVFKNASAISVVGNKKLCGGVQALQLPPCSPEVPEKKGKNVSRRVKIIVPTVIFSAMLILACICAVHFWARRSEDVPTNLSSPFNIKGYPRLSYAQLLQATDRFSSGRLIGEGSYGSVYMGFLDRDEQQVIAVKVLNLERRGAGKSFMTECETLRNIRHRNLVKIITSCSNMDFKALVYEFMPNGSLESWLHPTWSDEQESKNLSLMQRLNIAIDVSSALEYLHCHCEPPIVHCDLKPSNVLLDNDLCAHVGDFGLARFVLESRGKHTSSIGIRGTVGYLPPEYGMGGEIATHGDVYSFGILLMEIFTGKSPTDNLFANGLSLHNFVRASLFDRVSEIIDHPIAVEMRTDSSSRNNNRGIHRDIGGKTAECLAAILRIGVQCSVEQPQERMDIKQVQMELHAIRNALIY